MHNTTQNSIPFADVIPKKKVLNKNIAIECGA